MNRFLVFGGLLLSAALIAPIAFRVDNRNHQGRRYYDRNFRDYHQWNGDEDRAYGVDLQEQHRDHRDFNTVKRVQQQQYFRWRHDHPNNTLFKLR